jgi:hypothetical protein
MARKKVESCGSIVLNNNPNSTKVELILIYLKRKSDRRLLGEYTLDVRVLFVEKKYP